MVFSGKIKSILLDAELVSEEEWADAQSGGASPLEELVQLGKLTEEQLLSTLGSAARIPPVSLARVEPDPSAVEALSQEVCRQRGILPIAKNGGVLTIAIGDPFDVMLLDDLRLFSGCRIQPVLSHPAAIRIALDRLFEGDRETVEDLIAEVGEDDIEVRDREAEDLTLGVAGGDEMPAVKLANWVLLAAIKEGASDIHIEPCDAGMRVRIRVDGSLRDLPVRRAGSLLPALISRLKILANLDIAERMAPQDGKFQIRYEARTIDLRLSTLPVMGGEKAVMRILDSQSISLRLEAMGFEPKCLEDFQAAISTAYGMVLVTGPTGSGKSTTLYSAVQQVASSRVNVVTVEDPVEYDLDGVNQVSVNPKRGLTFSGALRSILRQDPDIVLVGEIRDAETAEIAVKAALTGHLVLSTLHTNDAAGAVTRLVDMGVDPFMVSSSLVCVAAQRLVRQLCAHCRRGVDVPEAELLKVGFDVSDLEGLQIFEAASEGCPRCNGGYRGRFALLETLPMEGALKRLVVEGRSVQEIKAEGLRQGMLTLRRAGLLNVKRGRTSLAEVLRVTVED